MSAPFLPLAPPRLPLLALLLAALATTARAQRPLEPAFRWRWNRPGGSWVGEPALAGTPEAAYAVWIESDPARRADRLVLGRSDGGADQPERTDVTPDDPGLLLSPAITAAGDAVTLAWSEARSGAWVVRGRRVRGGEVGAVETWAGGASAAFRPSLATADGEAWLAWETFRGGEERVFVRALDAEGPAQRVSTPGRPAAGPVLCAGGDRRLWIAWSELDGGDYRVVARARSADGGWSAPIAVSAPGGTHVTPKLARRPGGVWISWQAGRAGGEPAGAYGRTLDRTIRVAALGPGGPGPVQAVPLPRGPTRRDVAPKEHGLAARGEELCVAYRYVAAPDARIVSSACVLFDGEAWSDPVALAPADGPNEAPGVLAGEDGWLVVWHARNPRSNGRASGYQLLGAAVSTADFGEARRPGLPAPELPARIGWTSPGPTGRIRLRGEELRLVFGTAHTHSDDSRDGLARNNPVPLTYRQLRDFGGLDFAALTNHGRSMDAHQWWTGNKWAHLFGTRPGFCTLAGIEWTPKVETEGRRKISIGHKNVVYPSWTGPLVDRDVCPTPDDLWRALEPHEAITIPHHPASPAIYTDWSARSDRFQTLVEVFQQRGNFEYPGAPLWSERGLADMGRYVHGALRDGHRLGLLAAPDHPGLAGIGGAFVAEPTRREVFDAMRRRRTLATTLSKPLVDLRVSDAFLGEELVLGDSDPVVHVRVESPTGLRAVEVFRIDEGASDEELGERAVVHAWSPAGERTFVGLWVDADGPAEASAYYVRVTADPLHEELLPFELCWTSPVFVSRDLRQPGSDEAARHDPGGLEVTRTQSGRTRAHLELWNTGRLGWSAEASHGLWVLERGAARDAALFLPLPAPGWVPPGGRVAFDFLLPEPELDLDLGWTARMGRRAGDARFGPEVRLR